MTKELFFQKTKTCYDELLKDAGNDKKKAVLALYNKAKFYAEFGKNKIAKEQYFKRIALDPYAPDGYYYLANYLQTNAMYDEAIANHKKRIYALIDMLNGNHNIIDAVVKIDSMRTIMAKLKNKEVYVERTAKLLKLLDAKSKEEFYAKKNEIVAIKKQNQANINAFKEVLQASYAAYKKLDVKAMDKELRNKLAKAYYTLGVVYWTNSYSTEPTQMAANYRLSILNSGFRVLDESIRLDPLFPEPWSYKALLWFQMKKINPEKSAEYMAKNKENNNVFKRLIKKRADMKRFEDAQKNV
jgi:tetratricopeptide (TPR) repeat protein